MQRNLSDTYQIIGIIGSGGCGDVYKAYHKNLKKYVVLKKIRTGVRNLMNSRREADVLKNLRHSCIPQVLDFLEIRPGQQGLDCTLGYGGHSRKMLKYIR